MSINPRAKGARVERALAALLTQAGIPATKIGRLEDWLSKEADILLIKPDRKPPMAILPWPVFIRLMRQALSRHGCDRSIPML
jgi:hypothetical protein